MVRLDGTQKAGQAWKGLLREVGRSVHGGGAVGAEPLAQEKDPHKEPLRGGDLQVLLWKLNHGRPFLGPGVRHGVCKRLLGGKPFARISRRAALRGRAQARREVRGLFVPTVGGARRWDRRLSTGSVSPVCLVAATNDFRGKKGSFSSPARAAVASAMSSL